MNFVHILNNGHGSGTPGKRSPVWADGTQLFEYEFNRDIVRRIMEWSKRNDQIHCINLVPEIKDVPRKERIARVKKIHSIHPNCVLYDIHANAGGGLGWEIYTSVGHTPSDNMATIIYEIFREEFTEHRFRTDWKDGDPDKEKNFDMLYLTPCPAVLIENFFMDNYVESHQLMEGAFRQRIANTLIKAIIKIEG